MTAGMASRMGLSSLLMLLLVQDAFCVLQVSRKVLRSGQVSRQVEVNCMPLEVHLALTSSNSEMRVMWRTTATECPSSVQYTRLGRLQRQPKPWNASATAAPASVVIRPTSPSSSGGSSSSRALTEGSSGASSAASAQQQQQQAIQASSSHVGGAPLLQSAVGSSYDLTEEMMCSAPAAQRAFRVTMHQVVLTGLAPGETYSYVIAGDPPEGAPQRTFVAPPRLGTARASFIGFGDMGAKHHKCPMADATVTTMLAELDARPSDLILHVGDISYADGSHKIWDAFMSLIQPLSSRLPYMVGVGNHEYDYTTGYQNDPSGCLPYHPSWGNFGSESGGECGAMTAGRFIMPGADEAGPAAAAAAAWGRARGNGNGNDGGNGTAPGRRMMMGAAPLRDAGGDDAEGGDGDGDGGSGDDGGDYSGDDSGGAVNASSNAPFWYSFEYASIHYTLISTEHDLAPGSRQYEWLRQDLEGVDRCVTPWLVVALHRPMYTVYPHKENRVVGEHIRGFIEELLLRHDVDLTIAGHVHSYYRTCHVRDQRCTGKKDGSAKQDGIVHFVVGTGGHLLSNVEKDQRTWHERAVHDYGFARFDVDGDVMTVRFLLSSDGSVGDTKVLPAKRPRSDDCQARLQAMWREQGV